MCMQCGAELVLTTKEEWHPMVQVLGGPPSLLDAICTSVFKTPDSCCESSITAMHLQLSDVMKAVLHMCAVWCRDGADHQGRGNPHMPHLF